MAGNTDTRIVQMEFDNKEFERDIKKSEDSLARFKEELDFDKCEKSLDSFSKATKSLTFDSMAANLQKLTDKFTGLGTVSELVLSQIRRGIETTAHKISGLVNSLGFEQISVGKSKFEEMNKNVQTIIGATGEAESEVYRVMQRLNQYTDQTSYNFTDMASNIGKFTAVGIDLRDAEKQMEGIANWAARSGAGIQEASRAMYNLSQAMGVGKMTTIDWKSIENAGMATKEFKEQLIQAGLALGTLELDKEGNIKTAKSLGKQVDVNFQNLRETLQKGWANRQVMEKTLMGYYYDDLYYENEKILNLTREQLEDNEKLFKDNKLDLKEWTQLEQVGEVTNDVKKALLEAGVAQGNLVKETTKDGKEIYKTAKFYGKQVEVTIDKMKESLNVGWIDRGVAGQIGLVEGLGEKAYKAAQKCTTLTDVFNAWKDQLSTGWMKFWQKIFGDLSESMELFSTICNKVGESFDNFITTLVGDGDKINGIFGTWADVGGRDSLWSMFVGEYDGMYEGAYGFLDVLKDIGKMISDAFWLLIKDLDPDLESTSDEDWLANKAYRTEYLGHTIYEATEKVRNFIQKIKDFFNAVPEGETESRGQKIQKIVNGIFSVATIVYNAIKDIWEFFKGLVDENHLGPSIDAIINMLEALGITIRDTGKDTSKGKGLKLLFDGILESIKPLTDAINKFVTAIAGVFTKVLTSKNEKGETRFTQFWAALSTIFTKLVDVVSKVAGPIIDFVTKVFTIVSDLFTNGFNKESLKAAGQQLADAIGDLFGGIFGLFPEFSAKIEKFLSYIFGFAEDDASSEADGSGKTILGVIKKWLKKIFGGTADFVGDFKDELGNVSLFSIIKEDLGIGLLGKFIGGLTGIVKGTNLYGLIMGFLGGYALIKLIKLLKQGSGLFGTIKGFFGGLKDTLSGKLKIKFDQKTESLGDKLLKIGKAIALIAAAVVVMGSIPIGKLAQGVIALTAILGIIAGFTLIMSKLVTDVKKLFGIIGVIAAIGLAVTSIAISFGILVLCLKPLANMRIDQIANMLTGLAGILLILALFATYVKSIKIEGVASVSLLAIGIGLLILALKPLASMDILGIGKMAVGLIAILAILKEFSNKVSFIKGSGMGSFVMLAISVWILLEALKPLAAYDVMGIAKMAVGLIAILAILKEFSNNVGTMKGSGMGSFILLAASIWLLLESIKPLANYSWEQLGKIGAGLVVLMYILWKFTQESQSMKSSGMFQMIAIAASIWLIVQAIQPLANYSWEQLGKMSAGLVVLMAVIVLMTKFIEPIGLLDGAGLAILLLGLAAVIAAFALMMGSINGVDWKAALGACVGLIAILVVFALITKQMMLMKAKDLTKMLPLFVMLIALSVVMVAFSFAINEIKKVDWKVILAFSVGLTALLVGFAAVLAVVSTIPMGAAIKGILVMALGLVAIFGVIALIAPLVIGSIGNAIADMGGQLALLSGLIETFTGRMSGVNEGAIDKSENMLTRLKDMFVNLTGFIGLNTDISGFTTMLFDLGNSLENFAWHMSNTDLKENPAITLIKDLAGCANDLDTITKLNIDDLTSKITGLGGAMMLYADGAKEIAETTEAKLTDDAVPDVTAAVALMKAISESLADENGIVIPQNMPDETTLGNFGAQLAALAGALIRFEDAGKGLGEGQRKALETLNYFKDLKEKLNETNFVESYNEVTGAFEKEKIDTDSLEEFGKDIQNLGGALNTFSHLTTEVNAETGEVEPIDFSVALETLGKFVQFKNDMPDVDGVWQFLAGKKESLSKLGSEIETFGQALNNLSHKVTGTDDKGVENFNPATMSIVDLAINQMTEYVEMLQNKLPNVGGIVAGLSTVWSGRDMTLGDLGKQMGELGKGLHTFGEELSQGHWTEDIGATEALKALDSIMDIMLKLTEADDMVTGYGNFGELSYFLDLFTADDIEMFNGRTGQWTTGKTICDILVDIMYKIHTAFDKYGDIDPKRIELFKTAVEALGIMSTINPETEWEKIGKAIAEGVKSGIDQGTSGVIDAAVAMAIKSYEAVKKALDINSPSGEYKKVGEQEAEGLIEGTKEGAEKVREAASESMGEAVDPDNWDDEDFEYGEPNIEDLQKRWNFEPSKNPMKLPVEVTPSTNKDKFMDTMATTLSDTGVEIPNIDISNPTQLIGQVTESFNDSDIDLSNFSIDANSLLATAQSGIDNADTNVEIPATMVVNTDGLKTSDLAAQCGLTENAEIKTGSLNVQNAANYTNESIPIDYTTSINNVKEEIEFMRGDLRSLAEAMKATKFVLSTGAVVAAIGPEMDEWLGRQGFYAARSEIP